MTPGRLAYRALTTALHPLAPAVLGRRAGAGKEDPARLGERLGRASAPRPPGPLAWLHGASVGESLSVLPLIEALRAARPDLSILVTSGTTTSAELLAQRLPPGAIHQFTPLDTPQVAARFLGHWRPDMAVFVESELWPNLLLGAKGGGAKLALVSARVSGGSLRNWGRAPAFARQVLGAFDLVLAQDDATAAALGRLGARDDGRLNLKLLGDPLPAEPNELRRLLLGADRRPVFLAASTHAPEEDFALHAFAPVVAQRDGLLVIAPRHPARGAEVAAIPAGRGWPTARRSEGAPFGQARVHIADTLGELGLWFRIAVGAYIGGGGAPRVGGHNPLEAARLGCPVASGPGVDNWRGVYEGLDAVGGVTWTPDAEALSAFWRRGAFYDSTLRAQAGRARAFAEAGSRGLEDALPRLLSLLP